MKGHEMKTTKRNSFVTAGVCALVISFGAVAYAEKGAETLVRLTKGSPPGKTVQKCQKCTPDCCTKK